jgi:CPA2 family monovalent cation:H+ antiporter-2
LVLLPTLAVVAGVTSGSEPFAAGQGLIDVGVALAKAGLLTALMLVVGARVLPWLLTTVEGEGSRELFTLAVLAASLGVAFAATAIFDVSLALGGFLAGAVLSESRVSEKAAKDIVPLSDVFGVLFFVSVGMLLDPEILLERPLEIVALLAVVVLGKSIAALAIVAALRRPLEIGLTVGAGLAQVGEFSFIVATEAHGLGILPDDGLQLVVAVSLLSITLNPAVFAGVAPLRRGIEARPRLARALRAG